AHVVMTLGAVVGTGRMGRRGRQCVAGAALGLRAVDEVPLGLGEGAARKAIADEGAAVTEGVHAASLLVAGLGAESAGHSAEHHLGRQGRVHVALLLNARWNDVALVTSQRAG